MLTRLKGWVTSSIVKKYVGSWVRGSMRIVAGFLLAKGLADTELANTFAGSLGEILLNTLDLVISNPDLLGSLFSGGFAQWWSLKEKKDTVKKEQSNG